MKMVGREVEMFRCHLDPMIGASAKNAFMMKDMKAKAFVTDMGIHFKFDPGTPFNESEHLVPYANIQSIRLVKQPREVPKNGKA